MPDSQLTAMESQLTAEDLLTAAAATYAEGQDAGWWDHSPQQSLPDASPAPTLPPGPPEESPPFWPAGPAPSMSGGPIAAGPGLEEPPGRPAPHLQALVDEELVDLEAFASLAQLPDKDDVAALHRAIFSEALVSAPDWAQCASGNTSSVQSSFHPVYNTCAAPPTLREIFMVHVMCDYTPRMPQHLPTSRWATLEELVSKLEKHAPTEVQKLGHHKLRQMITEWYQHHPTFAGLSFSDWGKRLKDNARETQSRALSFKFCFEHTPAGRTPTKLGRP